MSKKIRRIGLATALIGCLLSGTMLVSAGPAQATRSTTCHRYYSMVLRLAPSRIEVENRRVCSDPDFEKDFPIRLEKLVGETWVIVAQGSGFLIYYCNGTAYTGYRVNGELGAFYACG